VIYSMTGMGTGSASSEKGTVEVEIRSVNARFLDVQWRSPRSWENLENVVVAMVKKRLSRGRVSVAARWIPTPGASPVDIDRESVRATVQLLRDVSEAAHLDEALQLDHVLRLERYWTSPRDQGAETADLTARALTEALDSLLEHRGREAGHLVSDMRQRLDQIARMAEQLRSEAPERAERTQQQLRERVSALLLSRENAQIDEGRLETELALLAQRQDTTEECVRLSAHTDHFRSLLNQGSPVGRKLEFLLQEMNRECATLSSKANDVHASQVVVEMKAELERLREQSANLE
jgi:uncharacterized protein (TIGR00255 family)